MHLPDGYLSPAVWATAAIFSATTVAIAARRARGGAGVGTTAALSGFVFAAQAFQFPIPGGSAGHLLGGTLLAATLGRARAVVAMATVFAVQAFAFHDGGLTTLGANVWNGGIVPALVGGTLFLALRARLGPSIALAIGAFVSTVLGAALVAVEMALSGTAPLEPALGAMLGTHVFIGAAEGFLSASLLRFVTVFEPSEAPAFDAPRAANGKRPLVAVAAIAAVTLGAAYLSSARPDGLEHAAVRLGLPVERASAASAGWLEAAALAAGASAVALVAAGTLVVASRRRRATP